MLVIFLLTDVRQNSVMCEQTSIISFRLALRHHPSNLQKYNVKDYLNLGILYVALHGSAIKLAKGTPLISSVWWIIA